MIPIKPGQTFDVPDLDGHDVIYQLRFITEEFQPKFQKLYKDLEKRKSAFIPKAEKKVNKEHRGKKWKRGEKNDLIYLTASQMFFTHMQDNYEEFFDHMNEWIDIFICGWFGKEKKIPKFPEEGKPSRCFAHFDKFKAYSMVMMHLNDLVSVSPDELGK